MIIFCLQYLFFGFLSLLVMLLPTSLEVRFALPNLLLMNHLFFSYRFPKTFSLFTAFFAGLVYDVFSGMMLGVYGLLFFTASYLLMIISTSFYKYSATLQSIIVSLLELLVFLIGTYFAVNSFANLPILASILWHLVLTFMTWLLLVYFLSRDNKK